MNDDPGDDEREEEHVDEEAARLVEAAAEEINWMAPRDIVVAPPINPNKPAGAAAILVLGVVAVFFIVVGQVAQDITGPQRISVPYSFFKEQLHLMPVTPWSITCFAQKNI